MRDGARYLCAPDSGRKDRNKEVTKMKKEKLFPFQIINHPLSVMKIMITSPLTLLKRVLRS